MERHFPISKPGIGRLDAAFNNAGSANRTYKHRVVGRSVEIAAAVLWLWQPRRKLRDWSSADGGSRDDSGLERSNGLFRRPQVLVHRRSSLRSDPVVRISRADLTELLEGHYGPFPRRWSLHEAWTIHRTEPL